MTRKTRQQKDPIETLVNSEINSVWVSKAKESMKEVLMHGYARLTGQEKAAQQLDKNSERIMQQNLQGYGANIAAASFLLNTEYFEFEDAQDGDPSLSSKGRDFVETHYGGQTVYGVKIAERK